MLCVPLWSLLMRQETWVSQLWYRGIELVIVLQEYVLENLGPGIVTCDPVTVYPIVVVISDTLDYLLQLPIPFVSIVSQLPF